MNPNNSQGFLIRWSVSSPLLFNNSMPLSMVQKL